MLSYSGGIVFRASCFFNVVDNGLEEGISNTHQCVPRQSSFRQRDQKNSKLQLEPAYQAGSLFRVIYITAAYFKRSVAHYHDAVMPLHGFVYTRVLIFLLCRMGVARRAVDERPPVENEATALTVQSAPQETDTPSQLRQAMASCPPAEQYRFTYAEAVLGASLISVGRCIDPSATMIYLVLYYIIGRLSQWTAKNYGTQRKTQRTGYRAQIVRILHRVGIDGSYHENARESTQGSR